MRGAPQEAHTNLKGVLWPKFEKPITNQSVSHFSVESAP